MTPDYLDFNETRLDLGYDYGVVGGMEFKTEIIETSDGREQRQALRALPLGRWQLGDRLLLESQAELIAEVNYLKTFHRDRTGAKQGFRFKDWTDFQFSGVQAIADGLANSWQLNKKYTVGNVSFNRPILKPVFGTVNIFVDGLPVFDGWSVNHETGVISHDTPVTASSVITANFEFDVPVWFESDSLAFKLQAYQDSEAIYRLSNVYVVEGKMPTALTVKAATFTNQLLQPLDLGIIFDTLSNYKYDTTKISLFSGYVRTVSNRSDYILEFDLGDRIYDSQELDRILAYFWLARGRAGHFEYKAFDQNYLVRFNSDSLNINFKITDGADSYFELSGLKLRVIEPVGSV